MYHFNNAELLVVVLALLLATILAVRAVVGDRKEKSAPFRNYFGPGYQRELLRHSDLSESEDWRADRQPRFTPLRLRDTGVEEWRMKASPANRSDRESN
jgi:hypothetical protein